MRAFRPHRSDVAATLRLAAPVAFVQFGMMAMGVVDTAFVGHVSQHDLAAVALGNMWSFGAMIFGMGALLGVGPLLAQAHGAKDRSAFGLALRRALVLCFAHAALATGLQLCAEPALRVFSFPVDTFTGGADDSRDVVAMAAGYVWRTIPGTLPFYFYAVLREALQSTHRLRPVVITVVLANVLNLIADWAWVDGNLGFPAMGSNGAGWATALARIVMAIGLATAGWPVLRDALTGWTREVLRLGPLRKMSAIGVPIGGQLILEFGGFSGVMVLMGQIGTTEIAAHQVTISVAALAFMVPLGISQAAGVLVGNEIGRGDADGARRFAGAGLLVGATVMCVSATLFITLPEPIARLLTNEPGVVAVAALLLPIAGFFQVCDGIQIVAAGVLRGAADVNVAFVINLIAFWAITLPIGWWLGIRMGYGPEGLWWSLVIGLSVAALLLAARVFKLLSGDIARADVG